MGYDPNNNPYSTQQGNYGGAQANGTGGSQTDKSLTNATNQSLAGQNSGNPHQSFGNMADAWANVFKSYMQPQASTVAAAPQHPPVDPVVAAPRGLPLPGVDPVVRAPGAIAPGAVTTQPPNALQAAQQAGAPQQVRPFMAANTVGMAPAAGTPGMDAASGSPGMAGAVGGMAPVPGSQPIGGGGSYTPSTPTPTGNGNSEQLYGATSSTNTSPLTHGAGTGGAIVGGGDVASTGQAGEWPPHQGDINPESGKPYASTQVPPGIDQATWNTVDRWVQDAASRGSDYWYLYQKPELVSQFKQWQGADWATRSKVDPVDWLKAQGMPSPEAGRNKDANGNPIDTYQQWQSQAANGPEGYNTPSTYNSGVQVGADGFLTQGGQPVLDGSGNRVKPTQGPNGQWLDQFGHPILNAQGQPWTPAATPTTPTPTTPAPGTTPPTGPQHPPTDPVVQATPDVPTYQTPDSLQSYLQKLMNPQFENQMNSMDRGLRAQAALSGEENSGGFGANMALANSQLAGTQGGQLADFTFKADQANSDRAMQKYQIDQAGAASKYIAQLNNETEIAKMNSSADVQKYISDHANDLQKYGIDKNDALARYEAEYQRITAQMNQSAAHAGDAAQAALRNTLAQLQHDTDTKRLALEQSAQNQQYDLGVLGINAGVYNTDVNDRYRQMYLQWLMSPAGQQSGGAGIQLPGTFPY